MLHWKEGPQIVCATKILGKVEFRFIRWEVQIKYGKFDPFNLSSTPLEFLNTYNLYEVQCMKL